MSHWLQKEHQLYALIGDQALGDINSSRPSAAYMRRWAGSALGQMMACRLFGAKAITWTNAGLLLIEPLGTNFSEIWIEIRNISFMKMHSKMSSAKWRPFCPGERWVDEKLKIFKICYLLMGRIVTCSQPTHYGNQYWFHKIMLGHVPTPGDWSWSPW